MEYVFRGWLVLQGLALAAGCSGGGPSPAAPQQETPTTAALAETDAIEAGHIEFGTPAGWTSHPARTPMRKARFVVPGSGGNAELVVFYFGNQGAGTAQANIDRWVGQFRNEDGSPITNAEVTDTQVAGFQVKKVEASGRYVAAMRPGAPERHNAPGQRMIAAIVETNGGPYYFKLVGPDATVQENRDKVSALLASIKETKNPTQ